MLRQAYANECKHIGRQAKGGVQNQNRLSSSGIQTVLILGGLIVNTQYIRVGDYYIPDWSLVNYTAY